MAEYRRSPLHEVHERLGARFVPFAGWEMPVQYEGVIAEHMAVRRGVGVFDVSHLGRFLVRGEGATTLLRQLLCNDVDDIEAGQAQYSMVLNAAGGIIDDVIVWRFAEESYWVMPNGVNQDAVMALVRTAQEGSLDVESRQEATALIAVQGPEALRVATEVMGDMPKRFRVATVDVDGEPTRVAGTGYTGERGVELAVPVAKAGRVFTALVEAGATPCGLGARDTLRLEMGYPLWGQDLNPATTPLEAGLEWVVAWDHDFFGKEALERQRAGPLRKLLVAFVMEGRAIARHGYPLLADGARGEVASGNYSPVLERGIGMGYLSPPPDPLPEAVTIDVRGRVEAAKVTTPPFISS